MEGSLSLLHFNPVTTTFALVVFATLLIVLSKFVWGPVLKALDERDNAIRGDLDAAKSSKEESEKLLQEQRVAMASMKEEAKKIREEAIELAEKQKEEIIAAAKQAAENLTLQAKEDLEREKEAAFDQIKDLAVSIGVDLAKKIIVADVDVAKHEALIKDSLSEMESAYKKAS